MLFDDEHFMKEAIKEAQKALAIDEVPVGAIIVANNYIISRAHNLTERLNDTTAHAEMQAFTSATANIGGKYLNNCTLYVTLEPCVMCAGASAWTHIKRVVVGAKDFKKGFLSKYNLLSILHPKTEIVFGVLENECSILLSDFFKNKR